MKNESISANQQQSYNKALSKIQSAVEEERISSTNSDVQSLSKILVLTFLSNNLLGKK
ncbi:putative conjugative transfer TraG domain protein [Orientia tsutsugamushi str. Gilliam]|uniref:Putative conjugative transfer TraG domain protein n=1 Tax=Orientia tsutsugamushi str. Gilliam TaxID=1359184 RepID=A0A0F3M773_ORITS|nr:hypothetical protein [Orientia tsutsugamushi]KJV51555.1 putative conjugative transfer TraG domain protein [Orientia tsutsugamushi str. Gilliam]